jgi:lysozyme family protein
VAEFAQALPYVLAHEGGWSDDPSDHGGATMKGITLQTAQRHGILDKEALKAITDEQLADIYRADYWCFDQVDSQAVATKLFDMSVNLGKGAALRLAQEALNELGATLQVDGHWGPKTCSALNLFRPERVLILLSEGAADYYHAIVAMHPDQGKFMKGWLRRAHEVPSA